MPDTTLNLTAEDVQQLLLMVAIFAPPEKWKNGSNSQRLATFAQRAANHEFANLTITR